MECGMELARGRGWREEKKTVGRREVGGVALQKSQDLFGCQRRK